MDKEKLQITLLGAVGIEGVLQTKGASLAVDAELARNLLDRGKAKLTKDALAQEPASDEGKGKTKTAEPPKTK